MIDITELTSEIPAGEVAVALDQVESEYARFAFINSDDIPPNMVTHLYVIRRLRNLFLKCKRYLY